MNQSNEQLIAQLSIFDNSNYVNSRKGSISIISQCRICLEQESNSQLDPLIVPCNCAGSVKFVHFQCLAEWIKKHQTTRIVEGRGKYECQMCKTNIQFICMQQLVCKTWEQFKQGVEQQKYIFIFLTILLVLWFGLLAGGVFILVNTDLVNFHGQKLFQTLIIVTSLVLVIILKVITALMWIRQFAMNNYIKITKIVAERQRRDSPRKRSHSTQCSLTASQVSPDRRLTKKIHPLEMIIQRGQL